MEFIIIGVALIIYLILIAWTYQSLGFIEKSKKIAFIIIGIFVVYIVTLILFQIAKGGIAYPNDEIKQRVQNILVIIFTGVNGLVAMPQIGKILDKKTEDGIKKNEMKKRIIILGIVFIICIILEVRIYERYARGNYKDVQCNKSY